jgi:hypothetical protein
MWTYAVRIDTFARPVGTWAGSYATTMVASST